MLKHVVLKTDEKRAGVWRNTRTIDLTCRHMAKYCMNDDRLSRVMNLNQFSPQYYHSVVWVPRRLEGSIEKITSKNLFQNSVVYLEDVNVKCDPRVAFQ